MRCANCQHDNPADFRFCMRCGSKLGHVCPACSASLPPESLFCGKCGTRLPSDAITPPLSPVPTESPRTLAAAPPPHLKEKILTSRSALEGEHKQVTVLFADLKGSMELLADRDPEEARRLLDPVLSRMMEAVHQYEGTVNQVMGDGIMALFGAPLAHEDHAVRACYAALAMQEAVKQYAAEVQRTLTALKRVLLRESQSQPLLLVFEDLHWIDTETQALLDSLVESLPTARLLLLVNYRPEYQHAWAGKTSYTQLRLDPLPPEGADALLQAIADVPEDVLHRGLTHLQATELLYETSLFPERVYTFQHALTHEVAYGSLLHERRRALTAQGQREAGVAQMRQGLAAWLATGAQMYRPYMLGLLAEACADTGQLDEGLHLLAEALETMPQSGERWCEAELVRLKGELLERYKAKGKGQEAKVEAEGAPCFRQALEIARRQGVKAYELRAAMSLSRLWQDQGKREEARDLLAPIFTWFTEGFDTADLQETRALLQELS